jgi:hypothetical protein
MPDAIGRFLTLNEMIARQSKIQGFWQFFGAGAEIRSSGVGVSASR